jgi:hypothetical protein
MSVAALIGSAVSVKHCRAFYFIPDHYFQREHLALLLETLK